MGSETDISGINSAVLAYLGDAVVEVTVREFLVKTGIPNTRELNEKALKFVRAEAQSAALENILPHLTEEEMTIYKQGRNNNKLNVPKHSSAIDYRRATGFEALFGFLHMTGRNERAAELFQTAYKNVIDDFIEKDSKN